MTNLEARERALPKFSSSVQELDPNVESVELREHLNLGDRRFSSVRIPAQFTKSEI